MTDRNREIIHRAMVGQPVRHLLPKLPTPERTPGTGAFYARMATMAKELLEKQRNGAPVGARWHTTTGSVEVRHTDPNRATRRASLARPARKAGK